MKQDEIQQAYNKLMEKYKEYHKRYRNTVFNPENLKQRYLFALKNRMNMASFIAGEIREFEKLKREFEQKEKTEQNDRIERMNIRNQIDSIIRDYESRIKKYPYEDLGDSASDEMCYLVGALKEFHNVYMPLLYKLKLKTITLEDDFKKIEKDFFLLFALRGGRYYGLIERYINRINAYFKSQKEIEQEQSNFIKNTGLVLNDILDFVNRVLEYGLDDPQGQIRIDPSLEESLMDFYKMKQIEVIREIKSYLEGVIYSFRLFAFKRKKQ